ncbi:MAG: hypothetical protein QW480_01840 [Candidatus Aenigmatarchaeota archaeon]
MNFFVKGALIILTIFVALFIIGILTGERCYEIGACKECWIVDDAKDQYNSLIDLITCACKEAKERYFQDSEINYKIEFIYESLMQNRAKASAIQICNGEVPLVKYED